MPKEIAFSIVGQSHPETEDTVIDHIQGPLMIRGAGAMVKALAEVAVKALSTLGDCTRMRYC